MSATGDECRRKAEEAERQAVQTHDPAAKDLYRDVAAKWRDLAVIADRRRS